MRINKWGGLVSTASPYILPPGGAVEQTNITSMVPGQLSARAGMKKMMSSAKRFLELWGYSVGSSTTDTVLSYESDGTISSLRDSGGSFTATKGIEKWFDPAYPVSFSQGRRGEVYIYQGHGKRGLVRSPGGNIRPVGIQAPTIKPTITVDTALRYYVARIDLTDTGEGYNLPPAVYIGPPTEVSPRQAKAVTRISGGQISEVEVTDGGAGYTKTPIVKFTDQPGVPVTGKGASATLSLIGGAGGNYKTGVVYWEVYKESNGAFQIFQCNPQGGYVLKWRNGFVVPACGGSGTGASLYVELTPWGRWYYGVLGDNNPSSSKCGRSYPSQCNNIAALEDQDEPPLGLTVQSIQVFDFGSGYKPGDEVYVELQTATAFGVGWTGGSLYNCATYPRGCPVVIKGYVYGSSGCPDDQTCTDASPARQAPINPVLQNPGSGYLQPPVFYTTDGDRIDTEIDDDGRVVKLIVSDLSKKYLFPPDLIGDGGVRAAKGLAIMRPVLRGTYQCYYRFVKDDVPESEGGPLYSNLSPVEEVKCGDGASALNWGVPTATDGANAVELWRTSSDQATTLFRVAKLGGNEPFGSTVDTLSDYDLTNPARKGFLAMPILLSDGSLNANRFGVAPTNFAVGVVFQDRTWLAVDTGSSKPNTLMYSEADEPEAIPEVNELILQTNVRDTDYITALIPYAGALIVAQSRHCHRLSFVNTPSVDATTNLIAYRGCLNQRCWDLFQGILYMMDDYGLYSLDQQGNVEHLSLGLDSMFRENSDTSLQEIDFSKRRWFIVRADRPLGLIRAHVAFKGDSGTYPTRQIVYSPQSKTFWMEQYPAQFSSAADLRASDGQLIQIHGAGDGLYRLGVGLTDDGDPVSYSYKSGNFEFVTDMQAKNGGQQSSRQISVVYKPTKTDCRLNLSLYYNGSKTPRANVARRDRGVGFVHDDSVPAAYVNLKILPHQEAETNGVARALFAGKTLEDFSGNDTHVAIQLWGTQDEAGPVVIHSVDLMGVNDKGE